MLVRWKDVVTMKKGYGLVHIQLPMGWEKARRRWKVGKRQKKSSA